MSKATNDRSAHWANVVRGSQASQKSQVVASNWDLAMKSARGQAPATSRIWDAAMNAARRTATTKSAQSR
jgi:hypothetical protein